MTSTVLTAFTADRAGRAACLLPAEPDGSGTLVARIATAAADHGPVAVLTRPDWVDALATATDGIEVATGRLGGRGVEVVGVPDAAAGLAWLVDPGRCRVSAGDGVAVVQAHLVADDVALGAVVDGAGPTGVLASASGGGSTRVRGDASKRDDASTGDVASTGDERLTVSVRGTRELRAIRGRVVAASSAAHNVAAPTHRGHGALHLAAAAVGPMRDAAETCRAAILAEELPDDDDLVAWLTVALVRNGTRVGVIAVPRLGLAALVTDPAAAIDAARRRRARPAEAVRLDASVKQDDGFFTTFFVSSYSPWLARLAARLGLTPDVVTWSSLLFGVAAAGLFATGARGPWIAGAVVLQLAFTLDCVDGQLARYTRRFTTRGAWLDAMFDRGKEYLVYAGLAVGGVRAGDELGLWLLAGAALALQTFRHTLDLGYADQQARDVDREVRRALVDTGADAPGFWERGHHDVEVAPERTLAEPTPADPTPAHPTPTELTSTPAELTSTPAELTSTPAELTPTSPAAPTTSTGPAARVILALRRAEGIPGLRWGKRIVTLPIGERFALISVLAATTSPRTVFLALLIWGGLAAAYTAGGRIVRSVA